MLRQSIRSRVTIFDIQPMDATLRISAYATCPLGNATTRKGSSRADTVPKGISQPHLHLFRDTSVPLPEPAAAGATPPVS
jgi:hypothetical protein